MCQNDIERNMRMEFFSWRNNGYHKPYGYCEFTLGMILEEELVMPLIKNGREVSRVHISAKKIEKPSFVDFLKEWELNLMCAIDFTASNGELTDPKSLHFLSRR